jgi:metal-responsive CopG/Arc/MetJ family transcriptional regulator
MPTVKVNFSIPKEVKKVFDEVFAGQNKSAIITRLMQEAIDERHRQARRAAALDAILELRRTGPPFTDGEIAAARRRGRP